MCLSFFTLSVNPERVGPRAGRRFHLLDVDDEVEAAWPRHFGEVVRDEKWSIQFRFCLVKDNSKNKLFFLIISSSFTSFTMAEFDEYESLPEDTPFHISATAGALAGIAEHVALYPVDSVKVRVDKLCPNLFIFNNPI